MADAELGEPVSERIQLVINKMTEAQYQKLVELSAHELSTTLSNELFLTY